MGSHWVVEGPLMMAQSPTLAFCHPHLLPPVVWSSLLCCLSTATAFSFPISGHHHFTLAAPWESGHAAISQAASRGQHPRAKDLEAEGGWSRARWCRPATSDTRCCFPVLSTAICVSSAYPALFSADLREGGSLGVGLEETRPGKECVHGCSRRPRGTGSPEAFLRAGNC